MPCIAGVTRYILDAAPRMVKPLAAAELTALVVVVIVIVVWAMRQRRAEKLCAGPHNITIYDSPYKNYPTYEGRGATWWDGDRRCLASCQQSPCTVWCR
jgi:hypothetical protein